MKIGNMMSKKQREAQMRMKMEVIKGFKTCTNCLKEKKLSEFATASRYNNRLQLKCKECKTLLAKKRVKQVQ